MPNISAMTMSQDEADEETGQEIFLRRMNEMKKYLGIIVILSFFTLVACSGVGTSPKGLEGPIEKASIGMVADVRAGGYKLVDAEELSKWLAEKKEILVIDTNPQQVYDKNHIKGAVSCTIPRMEKELKPADKASILKVAGSSKDKTIVVYCGFTACQRSHWGAKFLVEDGFQNVYCFPGGITCWKEYGFPTEGR
jgi:rhodanese-related sulfurtransferase